MPASEMPDPDPGAVAAPAYPGAEPINYSVEPDVVECSASNVTLTVHADNVSGRAGGLHADLARDRPRRRRLQADR